MNNQSIAKGHAEYLRLLMNGQLEKKESGVIAHAPKKKAKWGSAFPPIGKLRPRDEGDYKVTFTGEKSWP